MQYTRIVTRSLIAVIKPFLFNFFYLDSIFEICVFMLMVFQ